MRIGIISTMNPFPWGGSEELWAETAFEALNAGSEVIVSVFGWPTSPPKLVELQRQGAQILRRHHPEFRVDRSKFGAASSFYDLFKANPDVILISQGNSYEFLALLELAELLYVTRLPYVMVCQYNDNLTRWLAKDYSRELASKVFARAFRVLFVSNQNRLEAERQLASSIPNSGLVLNPVNLSDRSCLSWPELKTARLASVARLEAKFKGQDVLIEALSAEQWKQRDWHLTLYGSGPDEKYLHSLVDFFGIQERITFAGHQSNVRGIWAREQILVMFSRGEGIPLALVEAMLCGRPAVVSDVGGNQEWITEGQTGFIADAPVIKLARAALERAWSARERWEAMGIQAHSFASSRLGDSSIPRLLDVLIEAVHRRKPMAPATAEELEQLKRYRALTGATLRQQAKRVARAGARHVQRIMDRWRTTFFRKI